MVEKLTSKALGLVSWAQNSYDALETYLGVLMLKCLRPLGVRDASEQSHQCPYVTRARLYLYNTHKRLRICCLHPTSPCFLQAIHASLGCPSRPAFKSVSTWLRLFPCCTRGHAGFC